MSDDKAIPWTASTREWSKTETETDNTYIY